MSAEQKPSTEKTTTSAKPQQEMLYDALKNVGVYNITTLMKRLGIPAKEKRSQEANKHGDSSKKESDEIRQNAKNLLKLMGFQNSDECAATLEKIAFQGREMLGEVSKPIIASAPVSAEKTPRSPPQFKNENGSSPSRPTK